MVGEAMQMTQYKRNGSGVMGIKDTAEYLEVHESTIYRLVGNGQIPAFKLGGQWRFKKDVIDQWLATEMQKNSSNHSYHRDRRERRTA